MKAMLIIVFQKSKSAGLRKNVWRLQNIIKSVSLKIIPMVNNGCDTEYNAAEET